MRRTNTRRLVAGAAALAVAAAGLAACGAKSDDTTQKSSGPVTIQYWGWVPGMQKLVDEWNSSHPDIQVKYSAQSAGDDATFSKITTAAQAGDAPDLVQVDVKWVTGLVKYAKDVTAEASQYKDDFTAGAWSNVTLGGKTYGLPQDSGPMVMYYNKAKFEKYGLAVPQTWADFAADAEKVAKEHPGTYLAGFSSDDTETLQSYVQQAGGQWWAIDGNSWKVDVTGAASEKVADFWQGLVDKNAVSPIKRWDPAFNNELAKGKILSIVGAAWQAPGIVDNAAALAGDWAVAPMPQWEAGAHVSANNGGSQLFVMDGTKHAAQALEFADWLNTNVKGLLDLGLFPATAGSTIATPGKIKSYFGGQDVYAALSEAASQVETQWLFPPIYPDLVKTLGDGISEVRNGTTTLPDVLNKIQQQSLDGFKQAGASASAAS